MKTRYYFNFVFSSAFHTFADILFDFNLIWQITAKSNNISNAAIMLSTSIIFRAIIANFIGILVDSRNKKKLMVLSNINAFILVIISGFLINFLVDNVWMGIIIILINNVNNEIFSRSHTTIATEVFTQKDFIKYAANISIINNVLYTFGQFIVGILISILSTSLIITFNSIIFLLSGASISMIIYSKNETLEEQKNVIPILKSLSENFKIMYQTIFKSSYLRLFVAIMLLLNLAYGYILNVLPLYVSNSFESSGFLGLIRGSMSAAGILGLLVTSKYANYVSRLFFISMCGSSIVFFLMPFINNQLIIILFLFYGFVDSLSQPFFNYTISSIDKNVRGRVIAGIDAIIMLSPGAGIWVINLVLNTNKFVGFFLIALIFLCALLIFLNNKVLRSIKIRSEGGE